MSAEKGSVLLVLLFLLAALVISLGIAAPRLKQQIRRDREIEMIHRGEQYARAVKRYYLKFNRQYPTSIEQLEKTNNIRFLRKRYKDPMSPDGQWKLVRYGDPQLAQAGAIGGNPVGTPAGGGATGDSPQGGGDATSGAGSKDSGSTGSSGFGGSSSLFGGGTGSANSGPSGSLFGSSATGRSGQTFGGGPIVGVASLSEESGIHEFNNKKQYNQWLFIYNPAQDPTGTRLIKGPYNPKAFVGQFGGQGPLQGPQGQPIGPGGIGNPGGFGNPGGLGSPMGSPGGLAPPPNPQPPTPGAPNR